MLLKRKRSVLILAFVLVIIAAIIWVGRFYVLNQIKTRIENQLHALRDSGYIVKYDSIGVNTNENTVSVYRLSVKRSLDSALCSTTDFFSAKYIRAEGFSLLPLLLKSRLSFKYIEIDSPRIVLYQNFFVERDTK